MIKVNHFKEDFINITDIRKNNNSNMDCFGQKMTICYDSE